jgi:hypothetical protein
MRSDWAGPERPACPRCSLQESSRLFRRPLMCHGLRRFLSTCSLRLMISLGPFSMLKVELPPVAVSVWFAPVPSVSVAFAPATERLWFAPVPPKSALPTPVPSVTESVPPPACTDPCSSAATSTFMSVPQLSGGRGGRGRSPSLWTRPVREGFRANAGRSHGAEQTPAAQAAVDIEAREPAPRSGWSAYPNDGLPPPR